MFKEGDYVRRVKKFNTWTSITFVHQIALVDNVGNICLYKLNGWWKSENFILDRFEIHKQKLINYKG